MIWVVAVLLGCSSPPTCDRPEQRVGEGEASISCEELAPLEEELELLAGRPLDRVGRGKLYAALAQEPVEKLKVRASEAATRRDQWRSLAGIDAATERSARVWLARSQPKEEFNELLLSTAAVWAFDDQEKLVLTESDIEGWIRYASLCREVQGGDPLRLSVADRVTAYKKVIARFDGGDRQEKIAVVSVGALWNGLRPEWHSASYEKQQAWIAAAPLPPPMTADSIGYFSAIVDASPVSHAQALADVFGPLPLSSDVD